MGGEDGGNTRRARPETEARTAAQAEALHGAGELALRQKDYGAARALFAESLAIFRELGENRDIAGSLNGLGMATLNQWDFRAARAFFEESLALYRELGDKGEIVWVLYHLGIAALVHGDLGAARALFEESLVISRAEGTRLANRIAGSLGGLACVAYAHGDYEAARSHWVEGLPIHRERGNKGGIAKALEGLAAVAVAQAEVERAARLFGAAERLREAMGTPLPPAEHAEYDRSVAVARAALGVAACAAAWAGGRATTLEDAVASALEGASPREAASLGLP
jgi:tetratricopeptide (TPR) repeat protein